MNNTIQLKLLFLAGSSRKGSVNKMLAKNACALAQGAGADAQFIDLKDYTFPIYDGDGEAEGDFPEKLHELQDLFALSHGIFMASPEYNGFFSPLLKNTLDWLSRPGGRNKAPNSFYKNKVVCLGAASPSFAGGLRGLMALRLMLASMGAIVLPKQITISNAFGKFDQEGVLTEGGDQKVLEEVIDHFVEMAGVFKSKDAGL